VALFYVVESMPELRMNATVGSIVDNECVMFSCCLKYKSHFQRNLEDITITIEHPGSDVIDTFTQRNRSEISAVTVVKAKSSKNTEEPTIFGPILCRVEFVPQVTHPEFAQNQVHFDSTEINASCIQCKCFIHYVNM